MIYFMHPEELHNFFSQPNILISDYQRIIVEKTTLGLLSEMDKYSLFIKNTTQVLTPISSRASNFSRICDAFCFGGWGRWCTHLVLMSTQHIYPTIFGGPKHFVTVFKSQGERWWWVQNFTHSFLINCPIFHQTTWNILRRKRRLSDSAENSADPLK